MQRNTQQALGESLKDCEDKLVCGRCSAEFSLSDLDHFVQHKEVECISSIPLSLVRHIQQASAISAQCNGVEVEERKPNSGN